MKRVLLGTWIGGAALCATLLVGAIHGHKLSPAQASFAYVGAFLALTFGIFVWWRRPESRIGILLTAVPLSGVLSDLRVVFWGSRLAETVGFATIQLVPALIVHLVLAYPGGRLTSRLDRAFVAVAYAFALTYALVFLLFYDPRFYTVFGVRVECRSCAPPPLTHVAWYDVTRTQHVLDSTMFGLAFVFVALLIRKLARATPRGRSVVLPLVAAATFGAGQFAVQVIVLGAPVNSWTHSAWFWIVNGSGLAIPFSLGLGLLWGRTARSAVADLVVALERTPPGSVRDALARTLGDPSLELALWLPQRGSYVDADGRPLELPAATADRAVTVLGPTGAPVAALVHDAALLERRALLEAAGAAARLALENARLHAELRLQLEEVRASRARIVRAGDDERRRLERNLHDGAQQRLLGLGLALQLARAELGEGANGAAALLAEAEDELRYALDELRELARGIHPAILTDQGLGAALRSLAERAAVPVSILAVPQERLSEPVEAAAYFLVSESLANVAKYAGAARVSVSVMRANGDLVVDVEDDGVGGADPARGSGLRGLLDRVQALDGRLSVESPPGRGTRVHAEIPCAS